MRKYGLAFSAGTLKHGQGGHDQPQSSLHIAGNGSRASRHEFEWYHHCRFRFNRYTSDTALHTIFKNLFKVIAPPNLWLSSDKRHYLQEHLLNLDWCFYYSEQFPSFTLTKLPDHLQRSINDAWDTTLHTLIEHAAPRYIFVHGQAIQAWVNRSTTDLKPAMHLENSRHQPCRLITQYSNHFL